MPDLIECNGCGAKVSPLAAMCPQCGHPIKVAESIKANKKKETSLVGVGCFYQILGIVIAAGFLHLFKNVSSTASIVLAMVFLVVFFVIGSKKAVKYLCGNCGTKLMNKKVGTCPVCKAEFTK
jgi:predicted amidophosphoribosyltransferase